MNKVELRREFLARRKALASDEVKHRSQSISQHFLEFLTQSGLAFKPLLIHTFLPIQQQHEVDTWLIIESVWEKFPQLKFAVSVTDIATNQLIHYPLYPDTHLQQNRWGIPEPTNITNLAVLDNHSFDMVIVPLLVFDNQGHRVGYGGGYYDRFLAHCHPNCLKVGVSLFDPVAQISDIDATDIRLDLFFTPNQLISVIL